MDTCHNCGKSGHYRRDCKSPAGSRVPAAAPQAPPGAALPGAKDHDAHLAVIDSLVDAWHRGGITTGEKRRAISDENELHYGDECRKELLHRPSPGDGTRVGDLAAVAAQMAGAESDAAAWAAEIRERMGWSEDRKRQRLRDMAAAQVDESRAARV